MFDLEAILTIPLTIVILVQTILYVKPIELRIRKQVESVIEERVSLIKNQALYQLDFDQELTALEVNPQTLQETISIINDLKNCLWDE
ncbi:MAG TPA: hypothetical protein VFD28_02400 [Candidatus Eisenbacteria bacterium]|nr:hypothetical protein [Candidatus Eisenbacteria bacterium]